MNQGPDTMDWWVKVTVTVHAHNHELQGIIYLKTNSLKIGQGTTVYINFIMQ